MKLVDLVAGMRNLQKGKNYPSLQENIPHEQFDCQKFEEKRRTLNFYEIADILYDVFEGLKKEILNGGKELKKEKFEMLFTKSFEERKKSNKFSNYEEYINYLLTCKYDMGLFLNERFFRHLEKYAFNFLIKDGLPFFSEFVYDACENDYKLREFHGYYTIIDNMKKDLRNICDFFELKYANEKDSKYLFLLVTLRSYLAELGLGGGAWKSIGRWWGDY